MYTRLIIDGRNGVSTTVRWPPRTCLPPDGLTLMFSSYLHRDYGKRKLRVLELGVGAGAYLVALAVKAGGPDWFSLRGVDINPRAAATAHSNLLRAATALGYPLDFEIVVADWLERELAEGNTYDMVYFNPQYLPFGEPVREQVAAAPANALFAANGGMAEYERVFPDIHRVVAPGGMLLVRAPRDDELFRAVWQLFRRLQPGVTPVQLGLHIKLHDGVGGRLVEDRFGGGFIAQYLKTQVG